MRPIRTLLVANRGEIARRILRTCRSLGIEAVAVTSEVDRDLPFVREADRAICIGPAPVEASYLNAGALIAAAERAQVDAVHPGYGFLSENASFARAVLESGRAWVGPPPEAIEAMGNKAAARHLAAQQGVPTVPGFDTSQNDQELRDAAEQIGVPLLIKAAAGGGGRGMRRVDDLAHFSAALDAARREAAAGFGDSSVLLERYVERPRHIEIQIFADTHGHVVHLFERECSIQRRHQKIVEEAPSPGVDTQLRQRMGEAACRIAEAAGYVGAGTAEFLLDAKGRFYFLEMNTRLQVEHPVTEAITGLDLVALQIAVAEGRPLPFHQDDVRIDGHAIEVRIYAEDPLRDYLPATGTLHRFDLPDGPGIRIDAGYGDGDIVGPHYDPMLAKVIAWGPDRVTATRRLGRTVQKAWAPGVITNLPLLRQILAHPSWSEADLDTHFLERCGLPQPPPLHLEEGAVAATVMGHHQRLEGSRPFVPAAWRMGGPAVQRDVWRSGQETLEAQWSRDGDTVVVVVGDRPRRVRVLEVCGDAWRLEVDGEVATWRIARAAAGGIGQHLDDGDLVYVHFGRGEAFVTLEPRFPVPAGAEEDPGSCTAPTPGLVAAVHVSVGDHVNRGQQLVTLEAMKMEHAVVAPQAGRVDAVRVAVGDAVDSGDLLVHIDPAEPAAGDGSG